MKKLIGQTKDVGFQFGLRKTFSVPQVTMWHFMFSNEGLNIWLGELQSDLEINKAIKATAGTEGFVRVFKSLSHIRMNWRNRSWSNLSTLQVRVIGDEKKSTIIFHQEKLEDSEQRADMKAHWTAVMEAIMVAMTES